MVYKTRELLDNLIKQLEGLRYGEPVKKLRVANRLLLHATQLEDETAVAIANYFISDYYMDKIGRAHV